jgi:inorganic pyrophosphatase
VVTARVVGLFKMADEKGDDDHVLCVPITDPGWNHIEELDQVPGQLRQEITHFFSVYKDLDLDRHSEVKGWGSAQEAADAIERSRDAFLAERGISAS